MTLERLSAWLHRAPLRFYPAEFREEFETEMVQDFHAELRRRTPHGLPRLWLRVSADWLVTMVREHLDVTRRDLHTPRRRVDDFAGRW